MREEVEHNVRARRHRWFESVWVDIAIAVVLAAAVFVVHPLSYALHQPFWLDEAWVATLVKAPFSRALEFSSSTPIGWLFLVRLVPGGRGEQYRWVPLLFSAAEVAMAYALGRRLPWGSERFARAAAVAIAVAVLLAPLSLIRNDLKQYTADAFFALLILFFANRAEGAPGPRTMTELAIGSIVATFFSTTAAFVVVAVFAGLLVAALLARTREQIRTVVIGGAIVAAIEAGYFLLVVVPHTNPALRAFWDLYYLPASPRAFASVWTRLTVLAPAIGLPAILAIVLFAAGCVVLFHVGRPGLAVGVALLWVEMMIVAMARRYPLLDLRTSEFLLVVSLVTIVIGFLGIIRALLPQSRLLVTAIAILLAALYVHGNVPYIRARSIPNEDARAAVDYVARHRRPGDVVVVTLPSGYGFSYYWPGSTITYRAADSVSTGFVTQVRGLPNVVYVDGLTSQDSQRAMQRALQEVHPGARIWIIRTHLRPKEARAWQSTFHVLRLQPEREQVVPEVIWVLSPPS